MEHQEHEKDALEYFLKDCVKGLKHLFNRYGYISPSFQEPQPRGGVDADELVDTLGPDPDNIHKQKELHEKEKAAADSDDELESWKDQGAAVPTIGCVRGEDGMCECQKMHEITNKDGEQEFTCECYVKLTIDEDGNEQCPQIEYNCFDCPSLVLSYNSKDETDSRSSCTGSSCDIIRNNNKEIQLDSLEDLAHVIDQEVVHNKGRTPPVVERKDREYKDFIDEDGNVVHVKEETESETESEDDDKHGDDDSDTESVDSNLVDVASVSAPTKSDFPDESEDDGPKPWEIEHREGANF